MTITVESFNGHDVQDATYRARLERTDQPLMRNADVRIVRPLGRWPRAVRSEEQERIVVLRIEILSSVQTNREILGRWFRPGTEGALVVDFDGTDRVLDCTVRQIIPADRVDRWFTAVLVAPDPRWRANTLTQDVESVTATGQTWEVTNSGNATEDKAVFRIQPTTLKAASDDFRYKREIIVVNRVDRPVSDWAIELTDGGWDHAAEVTAGRSLSSGNDVRVLVDGVEVPRWDGGGSSTSWDETGTKIWANISLSPGLEAELLSTITDAAPATNGDLSVVKNSHQDFPDEGYLLLGDEVIRYTGKSSTAFTGITRGARGTSAAAATAGDTIWWVERRVQLMYGHTGASAPEARDERKPMINLDTSTNTSHVWNDFSHDEDPRSMQWQRTRVDRDGQSTRILAAGGEPAASMILEYQEEGAEAGKPNFNTWARPVPVGTAGGGTLSMTREVDDTLAFKIFGRDEDGNEVTLEEESGPQSSGTNNVTLPTPSVYTVEMYGRSQVVERPPSGVGASAPGGGSDMYQQFEVNGDGKITGWTALLVNTSGSPISVPQMSIYSDDGSGSPGGQVTALTNASASLPASSTTWMSFPLATPLEVRDGTLLHLKLLAQASTSWSPLSTIYPYESDAGAGKAFQFRVFSESLNFGPAAVADDDDQVTFDGVTIPYASATVPYVDFGDEEDAYWLDGTLTNNQTGQSVALALLVDLDDEIEIDVDARTVMNLTADESVLYGATFSDTDAWIEIAGGDAGQANELQYDETGLAAVTVDTDLRSRWQ